MWSNCYNFSTKIHQISVLIDYRHLQMVNSLYSDWQIDNLRWNLDYFIAWWYCWKELVSRVHSTFVYIGTSCHVALHSQSINFENAHR